MPAAMFLMVFLAGCSTPTLIDQMAETQLVVTPHVNGSKSVAFHRAIIDLPPGKVLGQLHAGLFKSVSRKYYWNQGGNPTFFHPASFTRGKKCPGFGNFVSEFFIDGKQRGINMLARFVKHFINLRA
jgi:hypothetical protein